MNKKEVQNFIYWYIPAVIGIHFVTVFLFFSDSGSVSFDYRINFLFSKLGYIVCACWLFINSPKHNLNKWLWGIFGLGAHLFAIVIYFLYTSTKDQESQ